MAKGGEPRLGARFARCLLRTVAIGAATTAWPQEAQGQHSDHAAGRTARLGRIRYANAGSAKAQPSFLRGVALLHSYEFLDAREAFAEASRIDTAFALARWMEALTHSQFDWGTEDLPAAQRVLQRFGPTAPDRLARAQRPEERAFGEAVERFLISGAPFQRGRELAAAMLARADAAPGDVEAAAFAARAALAALRYAPPEERVHRAEAAIRLAEAVLKLAPKHPGGVHYLIHATDSPGYASRGLAAADRYAAIAPDADHAQHMPSHIYLQLGKWAGVTRSNWRAWNASRAWAAARHAARVEYGWHSLQWLHYSLLQEGKRGAAGALMDTAATLLTGAAGDLAGYPDARYIRTSLAFQFGAETGSWGDAPSSEDTQAWIRLARVAPTLREQQQAATAAYQAGIMSLHAGHDVPGALRTADALRTETDSLPPGDARRSLTARLALQLEAAATAQRGDTAGAIERYRQVLATLKENRFAPIGPPTTLPPAEALGALLLATGKGDEARAAFSQALAERPGRSAALLGRARAEAASGNRAASRATASQLLAQWRDADEPFVELEEARRLAGRLSGER